jgi:aspartate/methionine/tyrosine aminotransferase
MLSEAELQRISSACARAGTWLVCDNTYEDFAWDGRTHHCLADPHVVHIFSFSKVRMHVLVLGLQPHVQMMTANV